MYTLFRKPNQVGSVRASLGQSYGKLGTDAAAATSDVITYTYTITNNGLLSLYNVSIQDGVLHENGVAITCTDTDSQSVLGLDPGAVAGLAAYPDNGLAPAQSLTCTASDGVTQVEVRIQRSTEYTVSTAYQPTHVHCIRAT